MEEEYDEMVTFLSVGDTPPGLTHSQKYHFKKRAAKFSLKDGQLCNGTRRVLKSREEARKLFLEVHESVVGHVGLNKTFSTISSRCFWRGMYVDTENWIRQCDKCQRTGKRQTALPPPLPPLCMKVSAVWDLVAIDLTGPFPQTADGYQYILTVTDYFSKWVEGFPMKTKSAAEASHHICSMIYRHGSPKRILSDQGEEFVDQLNESICSILGKEKRVMAEYHPQTLDLDKETNHNIQRVISNLVSDQQHSWDSHLEAKLFLLRAEAHSITKFSPFRLMYGREAVLPSQACQPFVYSLNPDV